MTFFASDDYDIPTLPADASAASETGHLDRTPALAKRHWRLGVAAVGALCTALTAQALAQGVQPSLPAQNAASDEVSAQGVAPRIEIAHSNIAPPPPTMRPRSDAAVIKSDAAAPASARRQDVTTDSEAAASPGQFVPASAQLGADVRAGCDGIADWAERLVCGCPA